MMTKNNQKTIKCDECDFEWSLNAVQIKEQEIKIGNDVLLLSFFTCPECNKIYRVMLKDTRYEELKVDLEKAKKKIQRNHGSQNPELLRMLVNAANIKANRLKTHCEKLLAKYPGTFTFVASENNHKEIKYLP